MFWSARSLGVTCWPVAFGLTKCSAIMQQQAHFLGLLYVAPPLNSFGPRVWFMHPMETFTSAAQALTVSCDLTRLPAGSWVLSLRGAVEGSLDRSDCCLVRMTTST